MLLKPLTLSLVILCLNNISYAMISEQKNQELRQRKNIPSAQLSRIKIDTETEIDIELGIRNQPTPQSLPKQGLLQKGTLLLRNVVSYAKTLFLAKPAINQ